MAEPSDPQATTGDQPAAPALPLAPAAQRGHLVVRDRVVEQVARRAARDVDVVTRGRTTAWRSLAVPLTGVGDGTRVDVDRTDDRVGLTVHLAVTWPEDLPAATATTREAVRDAVTRFAGVEVDHTDVVVDVAPADTDRARPPDAPAGRSTPRALAPTPRPPVQAPRAAVPSALMAVALVGVGVVGVRDGLVAAHVLTGTPWATSVADAVSGATPTAVVLVGGVVAVLLGLWFVLSGLRGRPAPHLQVSAESDVWVRPQDVARVARSASTRVSGVSQVKTDASRKRVLVTVTDRTGTADLEPPLREAVAAALAGLARPPRVKVKVAKAAQVAEVTAPPAPSPGTSPRSQPLPGPQAGASTGGQAHPSTSGTADVPSSSTTTRPTSSKDPS